MDNLNALLFPDRKKQEALIRNFVDAAVMVDIKPHLKTGIGKITLLTRGGECIREVGKDWVCLGKIEDLNDKEFNRLYDRCRTAAAKIIANT